MLSELLKCLRKSLNISLRFFNIKYVYYGIKFKNPQDIISHNQFGSKANTALTQVHSLNPNPPHLPACRQNHAYHIQYDAIRTKSYINRLNCMDWMNWINRINRTNGTNMVLWATQNDINQAKWQPINYFTVYTTRQTMIPEIFASHWCFMLFNIVSCF